MAENFIYLIHSFYSAKCKLPGHLSLLSHFILVGNWTILGLKESQIVQFYLLSVFNIRMLSEYILHLHHRLKWHEGESTLSIIEIN